jgi:hypothetical protein
MDNIGGETNDNERAKEDRIQEERKGRSRSSRMFMFLWITQKEMNI